MVGRRVMAVAGWFVMVLAMGCASTKVETVWKAPLGSSGLEFAKVIALVVNSSPGERRVGEEELVRALKPGQGVPGYTVIRDEDMRDKEKVTQAIQAGGFDGAVVLRLVASDKRTTYYPPSYAPTYGFADYYTGYMSYSHQPGYVVTDTIVRTEISVYSVKDGRLLWAGAGRTADPSSAAEMVRDVARGAGDELRKLGLIR